VIFDPGLAGLRIRWFDPIAEASELPDHSRRAPLLRLFGDGWAPFFVTDSLVQDQPNQPTLSMGNRPDGLIMTQARHCAAIDNFEDGSIGLGCGVGTLVENAPHMAVALRIRRTLREQADQSEPFFNESLEKLNIAPTAKARAAM
jgi:hypothetical protein